MRAQLPVGTAEASPPLDGGSSPRRPSISVVIPAKNEAANIGWVLARIPDVVDEVIVVDGLSGDGTLAVAKSIRPDVIVVHETRPGKGAALRAGFAAATGDYVVMFDADGSMDPGEIGRFVDALEAGVDLVKGSRHTAGGRSTDITPLRHIGNMALLRMANAVYGARFSELCYGYMAFRRATIDSLRLDARGFEVEAQIVSRALRAGLRVVEVPSTESRRMNGSSNLRPVRDGSRVLWTIIRERRWRSGRAPRTVAIPVGSDRDIADPGR